MTVRTVAMLTAGGLAPCLSSAVGGLIQRYTELAPDVRIIAYTNGYAGLLRGESIGVRSSHSIASAGPAQAAHVAPIGGA